MALEACAKLEVLLLDGNKLTDWPLPTGGGLSAALPLRELNLAGEEKTSSAPTHAHVHSLEYRGDECSLVYSSRFISILKGAL